jgi:hypothetical protein
MQKTFLQGLKPIPFTSIMQGLKPLPPKEKSGSLARGGLGMTVVWVEMTANWCFSTAFSVVPKAARHQPDFSQ